MIELLKNKIIKLLNKEIYLKELLEKKCKKSYYDSRIKIKRLLVYDFGYYFVLEVDRKKYKIQNKLTREIKDTTVNNLIKIIENE